MTLKSLTLDDLERNANRVILWLHGKLQYASRHE